ncbi:hypothetical protein CK203_100049 [Vitis vinifera]|uniref:F-box domain-containing protein n=1 Tax=Vitis vinifera TaxID=29760 RepID=A0A438DUN9_VITVI|nr:hypothetical protein CK203_100049 [Vitis vinifera]
MVGVGLEGLPTTLINEIIVKLDTETLCSVACVSRALRFAVSEVLPLSSSLDLSAFSPRCPDPESPCFPVQRPQDSHP